MGLIVRIYKTISHEKLITQGTTMSNNKRDIGKTIHFLKEISENNPDYSSYRNIDHVIAMLENISDDIKNSKAK